MTMKMTAARTPAPALPARWADDGAFEPDLGRLAERRPIWAASDGGRLVGHLGGFETDWGFGPLTWTPEWAWSAEPDDADPAARQRLIQDLYAAAADRWAVAGVRAHWLSVYADDPVAVEAFGWLGFGRKVSQETAKKTHTPTVMRWKTVTNSSAVEWVARSSSLS